MPLLATVRKYYASLAQSGPERFILWAPLWLMAGIAFYFSLMKEPSNHTAVATLSSSATLLFICWRKPARWLVLPIFLICLGFAAAQFRTYMVATPVLFETLNYRMVEGSIDEIEPVDENTKLVLSHLAIEDLPEKDTPLRIRVRFRGNDDHWQAGDRVRFLATLYPLPLPAMPGSYDFARHFYFRQIGGTGFAMGDAYSVETPERAGPRAWLNNLRHTIGEDMRAHMPGAVGAVAAAMTIGESGSIPEDTKITLRDAGLAHMLAISGLHMSIKAAVVFFTVRFLLSLWPGLALRLPVKKIAALVALSSAFIYLFLAGALIPAQRAFIMLTFLFGAILFDRRGITLRSLSIAAIFILLLLPESMFGASFQMSFAATLSIVALFEHFGTRLTSPHSSFAGSVWRHLLGIMFTSLAATLATAPFVIYHFNRFAIFGLLANMIVVPLATFIIMPGMVLALILMPLGWQQLGYWPLEFGTGLMIKMAAWVTSFPSASLHLPSLSVGGLALSAFGLMWLCLWRGRQAFLGLVFIALGFSTIAFYRPYDLMINGAANRVALRLDDGEFLFLRGRPTSFDAQVWLRSDGEEAGMTVPQSRRTAHAPDCDDVRCVTEFNGYRIVVARRTGLTKGLCEGDIDIVVSSDALEDAACKNIRWKIDKPFLDKNGAAVFRLDKDKVELVTAQASRGLRPWMPEYYSALYASRDPVIE